MGEMLLVFTQQGYSISHKIARVLMEILAWLKIVKK